jgi:NAD(P)-dependent dehydrogenase (short-subunit alcohol dehydrogenase family)
MRPEELREVLSLARREAACVKCNVVNWDDQVALFELAFERYDAVDIVVRNLAAFPSPRLYSGPL